MRTREESLEIIWNALGGNISTGSPAGKRVRTRDDSLRILQSAVTEPAPSVILNREAVKNPANRSAFFCPRQRRTAILRMTAFCFWFPTGACPAFRNCTAGRRNNTLK